MSKKITRCKWAEGVSLDYIEYHDREWGVPVYDDGVQFEFLLLEGAQAGLATSPESDALSKDLKKRGFRFVGSTIMYAHMQATGLVNDHVLGCFRHQPCARLAKKIRT